MQQPTEEKDELKQALAEIRRISTTKMKDMESPMLNIIQEKDDEDGGLESARTKDQSVSSENDSSSPKTTLQSMMSIEGIFGIVQANNDLYEVMNENCGGQQHDETDAYKHVWGKSVDCVEQSTKRAYFSTHKL